MLEHHHALLQNGGNARIRRQPQIQVASRIADVVRATDHATLALAVVLHHREDHAHSRPPGQRPQDAHQRCRAKTAAVLAETRAEIRNREHRAVRIGQRGFENRGVSLIGLAGRYLLEQLHAPPALPGPRGRSGQQFAEHRIAVQSRQARPHVRALGVDQRCHLAIADQAQFQVRGSVADVAQVSATSSSQRCS